MTAQQSTAVTTRSVMVYEGANPMSKRLFEIPAGTSVKPMGRDAGMHKIEFQGRIGYIIGGNLDVQSNFSSIQPIIGYDKVSWGTTYGVVELTYPRIYLAPAGGDINTDRFVRTYRDNPDLRGVRFRDFDFFQNKLFRVHVSYMDIGSEMPSVILASLTNVYGKFDEIEEFNEDVGTFFIRKTSRIYRYYNKNLTIIFRHSITPLQVARHDVSVTYVDETIVKQIESEKKKIDLW